MQQCINDLDEIALLISGKSFQCVLKTFEEERIQLPLQEIVEL